MAASRLHIAANILSVLDDRLAWGIAFVDATRWAAADIGGRHHWTEINSQKPPLREKTKARCTRAFGDDAWVTDRPSRTGKCRC